MKYYYQNCLQSSIIKSFAMLMVFGLMTSVLAGCSSSTSANEEDKDSEKQTRTFDLILAADGSTVVGTATTEIITEDDDAYIEDGFFITLDISGSEFDPPFDIDMNTNSGFCGTWDVQDGEKAEMPCDYEEFLSDPGELIVTSEDGDGVEAYTVES
ncbi:MAG: hypothetical protein U5K72_06290 [Balneolaceae bacterium]|nr:hypothetical protein [Balneolaceae bacterium]